MTHTYLISEGAITVAHRTETEVVVRFTNSCTTYEFVMKLGPDATLVIPNDRDNGVLTSQINIVGDGWFWSIEVRHDWVARVLYIMFDQLTTDILGDKYQFHVENGLTEKNGKNQWHHFEVIGVGKHYNIRLGKDSLINVSAPFSYTCMPEVYTQPVPEHFPLSGRIMEMGAKTYVGTKVLHAVPMNRGDYNTLRGWTIPENERYEDEGYLVQYADNQTGSDGFTGYISWSPKEVFEKAYQLVL